MDRNVKFIVTKRWGTIELRRDPADGLWRDASGCVYAFAEKSDSVDDVTRCGVGWFSLPADNPLTKDCAPHDYMYSSPAWQAFHTREESDLYLENLILNDDEAGGWQHLAPVLYAGARIGGAPYWENDKTNN